MEKEDYVCVCHRVSMSKLISFVRRENPPVCSKLSECLGAGTGCGWCIPFLEKLFQQHESGEKMNISVDFENYLFFRGSNKNNIQI